ncbi:MAG: hypoxanthine phosphoribosyltransferase [Chthonomonadales bacterium]|nr:hypoxanthine phosphoribosyltransferase [Chthonomonadales bacterium]
MDGAITDIVVDAVSIERRVAELGREISAHYAGRSLVVVGVLTGAVVFVADLMRQISVPMELDFVATSSYGRATRTSGEVRLLKDLSHPVLGRHLLLVEDIVDTGLTLHYLVQTFGARQPASVATCALLDKPARRAQPVTLDYRGFEIDDHFVVGYGLDHAGLYRNLPYVGMLAPMKP